MFVKKKWVILGSEERRLRHEEEEQERERAKRKENLRNCPSLQSQLMNHIFDLE
jgi:hypothetical protein